MSERPSWSVSDPKKKQKQKKTKNKNKKGTERKIDSGCTYVAVGAFGMGYDCPRQSQVLQKGFAQH